MILSTLVAEMGCDSCNWICRSHESAEIFSFELYHAESTMQPGVVYICDYEALPDIMPPETSFFCVGAPENANCHLGDNNIISFSGDIMSLLHRVGAQMTIEHKLQADKQMLVDAINSGCGLQGLIDLAYVMLKSPIVVVDSAYKILATDGSVIEERPDLELQRQLGHMLDINIDDMKRQHIYDKVRQRKYPYYSPKSEDTTHNTAWLHTLVYVYGIEAAQIGVMERDHSFTQYDHELTYFLSKLISLELQKKDFYKQNQVFMHGALLSDLLEGRLHDDTAFTRAHQLGWKLSGDMYLMTIFDRNYGMFDHKARVICDQIQSLCPNSRWVIWDNKIVFLLILNSAVDETQLWLTLTEYLEKNKLTASSSDRFSDLYAVQWKFKQCEAAYDIGTRLNPGGVLHLYKDYNLHHIGTIALDALPSLVFFHPGVIAMDKYDKENSTELLRTVREYLSTANDPGFAAGKLFIHKNTLFYRINKVKELFGIDFNNSYERMRVFLTILLMDM